MTIVFIDAEAKDIKQISEEVLQDSTKACVVYNIELAAFQSLENYLKENTKGKIFTQFSIAEPVPGDVFLIDENHEINFNGRQIELKRKEDNSFNYNFKSIVESSLNEVYIFKAEDYKFEFVNKGGLDNMGYSLQEMLDMTPIDIKPEMTFEMFEELIEPLISRKKKQIVFDTVHQRADKSRYNVEVHLQMMEQDGTTFFTAIIIDITAWKTINKEASERLERMSLLAQNFPDGSISLIDGDFKILFTDGEGYKNHGIDPKTLIGVSAKEILDPSVYNLLVEQSQKISNLNNKIYNVSFEGKTYQNTIKAIFDNDKQFKFFVLKVFDITELIQKKEAIEVEKNRYSSIYNALSKSALVSITDPQGIIIEANERFCLASKYEKNELVGHSHSIINSGHHPRAFWADMSKKVLSGNSWRAEVKNKAKDGSFYWVYTVINPIKDVNGIITSFLSIRYLITDKKNLEESGEELTNRLALATKAAKMGVWTYEVESGAIFWDDKMLEIYRIKTFDGQFETFANLIHESDKEQELKSVFAYIEDETVFEYNIDYRVNTSNDEEVYITGSAIIERDNGKAKKVTGVVWDCTNEKKAERQLKERNERLAQLESFIDQSTDAVQVSDETGRLVYINNAATQRLGIEKANVGNYHVGDFEPLFIDNQVWKAHIQDLKIKGATTVESINLNQVTKESFPVEVKVTLQRINGQDYVIANSRDITKRKDAEEKLKASEEKFRFIAENTSDGIAIFENNKITYSSHAYDTILGYSEEESKMHDREFIYNSLHPEDRDPIFKLLDKSMNNLVSNVAYQFRAKHKEGHYIWREDTANFFYNEAGEMIKSILVARDITKRKNSEIILQESEAKHRFLIETSQEMICLHDNTGHFKFVSPSMTKMAGYTPEELIGKDPYSFLHPDDINLVLEKNHKPSLAGTKSPSFQFRLRKKDETYIWLDSYIEPITDEKGKVISLLTGSRDISELKNIEIALEERNSFIENITNNLPGVVLQYRQHKDGRDEFSYFNKEAEHLWEIAPEVIKNDIGKVWEQVHKDDVEALRESFEHSKTELSIWENEHRFVMPDGRVKWLSCVGVPHRDSAGTTTWDNLLFDVTEKKKTQIELARSQEMVSNIANSIPGVVWIYIRQLNGVDTVDYISEGALRIFEISKEEILDDITSLWKMIHSDDLFEFVKSVDQSAKNLMPWKYDYRIVMPDGRVKWLSGGGNPRVLENGSIMWHSIALDVTDKKNIELDLKKTLKQLKLSIATGKMGIWELNLENGYLDWNDQMFNIFGVDKLSFDHKVETFNKCVHPEDLDFITNVISKFPENDKLADVQFRIIKPDGKIRHILVSGNPSTFNENGEFEKYIGVNIDVTHIAEYQEQLKASVEEKDALFKELHHRIKNNLQMVASLLYIKSTMTEETALKRFIDETSAKIHSISSIHEQLLQMKGIDKLDVKQYLDSLCRNLIQTYSYGYTKFDLTIDLDSAHMDIDKVLNLGLIVNEILSNAIKYAYPSGTNGKINVYLKHNNGQSILTVSDEGVGIPKEKLAGMNNSYGMQLITLFTKQIGGTLDIESENGAKFIIIFPTNG